MTHKEKADELMRKYWNSKFNLHIEIARECALIAVDETLWVLNELDHDLPNDDAILFYSEVKQELVRYEVKRN